MVFNPVLYSKIVVLWLLKVSLFPRDSPIKTKQRNGNFKTTHKTKIEINIESVGFSKFLEILARYMYAHTT
jgi:hypothetical protein